MPFPISSSGSISVPADSPDSLLAVTQAVEDALREAKARNIRTSGETILFRAGIFRWGVGWHPLRHVGDGELTITERSSLIIIHYHVIFVEMLIVLSVGAVLHILLPSESTYMPVRITWVCVFIANYLVGNYRFPRFLRAATEKAVLPPPPPA